MRCTSHPSIDDAVPCARCGTPYCDHCLVTLRSERVCAGCKNEVLRDVVSGANTAGLRYAHFVPRLAAWLLDHVMAWVGQLMAIGFGYEILPKLNGSHAHIIQTAFQLGAALFYFVYEGATVATYGKTIGKLALRVRVVRPDGTSIKQRQGWIRASVRLAVVSLVVGSWVAMPAAGMLTGILLALGDNLPGIFTRERTTIHDLIAGTRVVRETA